MGRAQKSVSIRMQLQDPAGFLKITSREKLLQGRRAGSAIRKRRIAFLQRWRSSN